MRAAATVLCAAWLVVGLGGCVLTSDVSRRDAQALVHKGARLIDVRSPSEYAERHPDEATNIPLEQLRQRLGELDRQTPIVVYCHTGVRAAIATRWLRQAGYRAVHNLGTLGHWYLEPVGPGPSFE